MTIDQEMATALGIIAGASMYQTAAIVMALGKANVLDPQAVITLIHFFADNQPKQQPKEIRSAISEQLRGVAEVLTKMITVPSGAGRG